jgi:hypothetical protein
MSQARGLSLFVRRLTTATRAQKRAVAIAFVATVGGAAVVGALAGADPIAGALFGVVLSILPMYIVLARGGVTRKSYSLFVPPAPQLASSYREGASLTVAPLVERLAKWGYRLEVLSPDAAGRPAAPAPASTPLVGAPVCFRESTAPAAGSLSLTLPAAGGLGALEVEDSARGVYAELALYLMLELGTLIRGTEFKDSFSSLSPESTDWLRPQVPDAPRALKPAR